VARLSGGGGALPSQHDDPHEAPRQYGVPQAIPGLELRARFARVGRPPRGGLRQGLGRADQIAFFAGGTATLGGVGGGTSESLALLGKRPTTWAASGNRRTESLVA
jgi:hypothetical protein